MKKIVCFALIIIMICAAASCGTTERETEEITTAAVTAAETDPPQTGPVTAAETEEPEPQTPEEILKDKTALFTGDSLMAGVSSGNVKRSFADAVAEKYGFSNVKNSARNAATVAEITGGEKIASQLEAERGKTYDFVIIEGGITDAAKAVDIGRIVPKSAKETSPKDLDLTKFAGGFENLLLTAKKLFPAASVGCVIAPPIASGAGCVSDMRRYVEVMRLACEKWGIPTLDLYGGEDLGVEYSPGGGRVASTNMNIYQGNGPEYAIDGDLSTLFWANGGAFENSTFTVDLGAISAVSSVNLIMGSEKYPNNYMHYGVMEYSVDGESFTKLCDLNRAGRVTLVNESFTARYVRIRSTSFDIEWPLITEFEIEAEPTDGTSSGPVVISASGFDKFAGRLSDFMSEITGKEYGQVFSIGPGVCDVASVLNGKKVIYYGDSICDKSFHDDPSRTLYYSYAGRISEAYGTKTLNRGRDSASLSTTRGSNTIIAQTQTDLKHKVDMIVIEGGVNDAMDAAPVGTVSDMTAENFDAGKLDKTTMAGGLEEVLWTLTENHPEAVIVYMINYRVDFNTGRLNDMDDYIEMIKTLCDKWGVVYLDLYNDLWFNVRFNIKSRVYSNDGLHPNAAGYDMLYPVLAEFMADAYLAAKPENAG